MKLSCAIATVFVAVSNICGVSASTFGPRAGGPGDATNSCNDARSKIGHYNGDFSAACVLLVNDCHRTLNNTQSIDLWAQRSCVAGATCDGVDNVWVVAQCNNDAIPGQIRLANMSTSMFSQMTGGCASESCEITQQNYIDFLYGSLSAIDSTVFPDSVEQVINWWNAITSWTQTGDSIPFSRFNDWLHLVFDANSNGR
ncbi:hypothetical protein VKT23_005232 [Stygiomarasmius scandens]|uniref:Uncharacterized protein n=1 Tax=Marasmiellus scandens TaxID=2682957 RepID=A0ABR1JVX8_9AGAR